MADNPIQHDDIIQPGNPFGDAISGIKELVKYLDKLEKSIKESAADWAKFTDKQNASTKTGQQNLQKAAKATQQLSVQEKEAVKIKQQLEREQAKLAKMDSAEYKALIKAKEATRAKNAELKKTAKAMQGGAKTTNTWSKALGSFAAKFNTIGNIAANVASTISRTFVKAIRGGIDIIINFDQAMANVKAISNATQKQFHDLSNSARALGGSTKFTATQVAELQKEYAKLGFSVEQIVAAQEATLALAAATGTDLARAAEVVGTTLKQFGLNAREAGRVTDVMARSFTRSALDTERFAEAMKMVGPDAKQAGISLEETTALLALLADAGIHGTMAGTSLRKIFLELVGTGGDLAEKLTTLSKEGLNLAGANDEVGARAKTSLLVLLDQLDVLPKLTKEFENAAGAAKQMADVQLNTLQGQLTILKSAYEGLILEASSSEQAMQNSKNIIAELSKSIQFQTEALRGEHEWYSKLQKVTWQLMNPITSLTKLQYSLGKSIFSTNKQVEELSDNGINLKEGLNDIWTSLKDSAKGWFNFKGTATGTSNAFKEIEKTLPKVTNAHEEFLASQKKSLDVAIKWRDAVADALNDEEGNIEEPELNDLLLQFEKDRTDAAQKAADDRIKIAEDEAQIKEMAEQAYFQSVQNMIGIVSNAFENAKQRELEAAGDNAEEKEKIEEEYAKKQQAIAIANALINGAVATTKTLAQFGLPLAIPFLIAQAAMVATEVGMIASQQFAEGGHGLLGEKGGKLSGPSHARGGVNLGEIGEAEGGEYFGIINKRMTKKYENELPDIFDSINNGKFHDVFSRANIMLNKGEIYKDPYTRKMYDLMTKQANVYIDSNGNQVKEYLTGKKRIIKQYAQ